MPCNDNRQQNCSHLSGAPKGVHTYNHNGGDGAFYQVTGTQNIYLFPQSVAPNAGHGGIVGEATSGEYYDYDEERTSTDSRELEPYWTIANTLSRIRQQVLSFSERFPSDNTIATICSDAEELVPLVRCVGRTMYQIQQVSPLFFVHPFFSSMESRAFKDDAHLKALGRSLDKFKPCQHQPLGCGPSGDNTCCWPSGSSSSLRECFRRCWIEMSHFLHVLVSSRFFEKFDIKDVVLEELITKLSLTWDLHCPTVDTIWVREAAGLGWYSIPLRFCETWKEFAMVMNQYCRKGPEVEYIRRGNWAIVDIADNQTIDQTCFTSILKPDMRFDIGIIIHLLSGTPRTCPQCGHQNRGITSINGWIHCSNTNCNNSYRIVSNSSPRVLESKPARPTPHSAGRNTSSLTDASRPSVDKKIWAKLSDILPRTSKPSSKIPLSLPQKEPNGLSGREHPGSSYLNAKFHRILANIPNYSLSQDDIGVSKSPRSAPSLGSETSLHSPDGGRGGKKNSQSTDPPSPSDRRSVPSDSQEGDTKHPLLTKDFFKRPSGAQVVQRLAKSNNETFVCLSVFGEKYRGKKRFGVSLLHRHEKKMYKHVVEQAGVYVGTVDTSLGIGHKGIAICRDVKAILEDPKLELAFMFDFILVKAKGVLDDVTSILGRFKEIRVALYDEMQRIAPGLEPHQPERCSYIGEHEFDLRALKRMGDEDLLQLTIAVLDRFTVIVENFMDWWSDLRTDVDSLTRSIEVIRKNPAIGSRVWRQWDDIEKQYKGYNSEIMAQQDYYHRALSDLVVPLTAVNRIVRSARG